MTETASQDQNLQRPVEQTLLDLVEAVNIVLQKRNSERMCEQLGKCRGSHNCLEKSSERMGEQIRGCRRNTQDLKPGTCRGSQNYPSETSV